jgi:DNA-binding response OmpR family regulator
MSKPTILLMDLDPPSAESTRRPLIEAGFDVVTAFDGNDGLDQFERLQPDLIIIEPMLPGRNGFEICRMIKQSAGGNAVPVVLLSAYYSIKQYRQKARSDFSCDEFLEKPVTVEHLLAVCNDLLHSNGDEKSEDAVEIDSPSEETGLMEQDASAESHQRRGHLASVLLEPRRWLGATGLCLTLALLAFHVATEQLQGIAAEPLAPSALRLTEAEASKQSAVGTTFEPTWWIPPQPVGLEQSWTFTEEAQAPPTNTKESPAPSPKDTVLSAKRDMPGAVEDERGVDKAVPSELSAGTSSDDGSDPPALDLGTHTASLDLSAALEPPTSEVVLDAVIELSGRSAVKSGSLVLLVDGEAVFSRELTAEQKKLKRFFKKMIGTAAAPFEATIAIPPGTHEITARVFNHVKALTYESSIEVAAEAGARIPLALSAGCSSSRPIVLKVEFEE